MIFDRTEVILTFRHLFDKRSITTDITSPASLFSSTYFLIRLLCSCFYRISDLANELSHRDKSTLSHKLQVDVNVV